MIDMEAIKHRDKMSWGPKMDDPGYIDRHALLAECERLREALRDGREQVLSLATGMGQYMRPLANIPTKEVVAIFDVALASTEPEVCRCRWSIDEAAWVHDCGMRWYLLNDPPTQAIGANYCPKCGLKLEVVNEEDPGT